MAVMAVMAVTAAMLFTGFSVTLLNAAPLPVQKREHLSVAAAARGPLAASRPQAPRWVYITSITGGRDQPDSPGGPDVPVLSGTALISVRASDYQFDVRHPDSGGILVVLNVFNEHGRRLAALSSRPPGGWNPKGPRMVDVPPPSGTVWMVLDTAQLENGPNEITVEDLRGHSDTRRVLIDNPVSETGRFFARDGLPEQSRWVPDVSMGPSGKADFHSSDYYSFFPVICSDSGDFEIRFIAGRPGAYPIEIRDVRGRIVRRLSVKAEAPTEKPADKGQTGKDRRRLRCYAYTQWDGKDARGREAPGGQYQVRVGTSPGRSGGTYQSLGFVHKVVKAGKAGRAVKAAPSPSTVSASSAQGGRAESGLRFVNLPEGQPLSGDPLVRVAIASGASGHVLLLLDGEPVAAVEPIRVGGRGRTSPVYWQVPFMLNTVRYANGPHVLEARDFHGHFARRSVVFENALSRVQYEPSFDLNTAGNGTRASHVTATLTRAQPWKVSLRGEKGSAVRTFQGSGRTILLAWDGDDDRGQSAPRGTYEIRLTRKTGTGKSTGTGEVSDTLGYVYLHASEE
jgi:flagellar hook assembly protein FlgD